MSRGKSEGKGERAKAGPSGRPKLSPFEIFKLIMRTYGATLPFIIIFVAVMLVATWVVTTLVFK